MLDAVSLMMILLGLAYAFHDFKTQGVPEARLDARQSAAGWEALVNRRGATWRKLDETTRAAVVGTASSSAVLLAQPSLIRRPVNWVNGSISVGFDEAGWSQAVSRHWLGDCLAGCMALLWIHCCARGATSGAVSKIRSFDLFIFFSSIFREFPCPPPNSAA